MLSGLHVTGTSHPAASNPASRISRNNERRKKCFIYYECKWRTRKHAIFSVENYCIAHFSFLLGDGPGRDLTLGHLDQPKPQPSDARAVRGEWCWLSRGLSSTGNELNNFEMSATLQICFSLKRQEHFFFSSGLIKLSWQTNVPTLLITHIYWSAHTVLW